MIQVKNPIQVKPLRLIDVGTKAKNCFRGTLEMTEDEKSFCRSCLECFQACEGLSQESLLAMTFSFSIVNVSYILEAGKVNRFL